MSLEWLETNQDCISNFICHKEAASPNEGGKPLFSVRRRLLPMTGNTEVLLADLDHTTGPSEIRTKFNQHKRVYRD